MNILTRDVARGVIGTTAVETAHTFAPVREAFWLSEEWRAANLRYYPWYGRGFIQLTWESNYARYGTMIQRDLLTDPDIAMQADVAALVMAAYFWDRGVADACNNGQWAEVRRLVQGAYAGLDTLLSTVYALA
jgi:predicted chitinase